MSKEIPYGYCHCGCGQKTNIAKKTRNSQGVVAGEPRKYIHNHHHKIIPIDGMSFSGGYTKIKFPGHPRADRDDYVLTHILVAEAALGKPLPKGAEIHHHPSGTRFDNRQIVICQDCAYHKLLHKREAALLACGHANWLKCSFCEQYDDPDNLYTFRSKSRAGILGSLKGHHRDCKANYDKLRHMGLDRQQQKRCLIEVDLDNLE